MILQGLFGIQLEPRGIRFRPVKPKKISGSGSGADESSKILLRGLRYRRSTLTIILVGHGSKVERCTINEKLQRGDGDPFLSADAKGNKIIEITLKE